jgi:hypothetical protein
MQSANQIGHALWMSLTMFWQMFWGLSLGFLFSAVVEVIFSKGTVTLNCSQRNSGEGTCLLRKRAEPG